jgi:D-alanine-D-alanine ligase
MSKENLNIVALHNISSVKEEGDVKIFYSYPQDVEIIKNMKKLPYDISSAFYEDEKDLKKDWKLVFNLCDAFADPGEELKLIEDLEKNQIPYTGCSALTTKICQNKYELKKILKQNDIKCPRGQLFKNIDDRLNEKLKFPLILKLIGENGSFGLDEDSVVFNEEELRKKLSQLFSNFNKRILVEEYIEGREFNIPLIGNENPEKLAILEIDYSQHFENKPKILTYKAKWSKNSLDFKNTYSVIADLSKEDEEKLYNIAMQAYKAINCTGYASVDLRQNENGEVYVLEVNSNCYIAPESDILKAAIARGLDYEELLNKIINYAAERFSLNEEIIAIKEIY